MHPDGRPFSADDIELCEPIVERIRRDPARYLGARRPTAPFLASALIQDALLCGARDVQVTMLDDGWVGVSADRDWILPHLPPSRSLTYEHAFRTLIAFNQAGPNSFRSEVLVAAFSTDISILWNSCVTFCVGSAAPSHIVQKLDPSRFTVLFRPAEAESQP